MKSITLHKLDDETESRLDELSKQEGLSLNRLIKRLLRESLGLERQVVNNRDDFASFCGQWTEAEKTEFDKSTEVFSEIDDDVWK